jgi:hypothetical protein
MPPTPHQLYVALTGLLRDLNVCDPDTAIECTRVLGEWPPSYIVFPADDAREGVASVLTAALERPFSPDTGRWRIEVGEARALVDSHTGEEQQQQTR